MVRIVAGELKGRRLAVPRGDAVRPTPDRVREALFSILGDQVRGAAVLDAYAGTGALGFEAASRGAASVVFIERDRSVADAIDGNIGQLGLGGRCRLVRGHAADLVSGGQVEGPFDLVVADPPFAGDQAEAFLAAVVASGVLAPAGVLVIEAASRRDPPDGGPDGPRRYRTARYGDVSIHFFGA